MTVEHHQFNIFYMNDTSHKSSSIVDEAKLINSSLKRASQHLLLGVLQADSAAATIEQDGATIQRSLHEHQYGLKSALKSTQQKLKKIKNSEVYERYFLILSMALFLAVVGYIVTKRTGLLSLMLYSLRDSCT